MWRRNAKTAELMGTIGVTLNRGKWQKVQFLRLRTALVNSFIPNRTTKTVAAEKYNPPPPTSRRPTHTHKHTHPEPKYTCNKEGEIKALIQWEGIGSWHKFRVNVWGYLLCWLLFLLSVLHCTPHANVNQGHTLYPVTYQAVNSCFSLISSEYMCVCVCRDNRCTLGWKNTKLRQLA